MKPFLLNLAALSVLWSFSPLPAQATNYGAIAYDTESGSWGVSWDWNDQDKADSRALADCTKKAKGCEVVVRYSNECGAYATGTNATGWGTGPSQSEAEKFAMKYCSKDAKDCEVVVWGCNSDDSDCARKQIEHDGCESRNFQHQLQGDSYRETCSIGCP